MPRNKLDRFKDISQFENVIEYTDFNNKSLSKPKGRWRSDYFKNQNPVVLELACGKGDYTIAMARKKPEKNFIGVDIKGARIWKGAAQVLAEGLKNAYFLRIFI